jgi:hypothetical protein
MMSVVENTNPVTKTIYSVNPKTGEITPSQILKFDVSYKATPFVFDDIDSAEAFAEGLDVIEFMDYDDELDNALESIENDIASTLISEGDPKSDPEYKFNVTEEEFEEAKAKLTSSLLTPQYVDILLPVGTNVFVVTTGDRQSTVTFAHEQIDEIEIEISVKGIKYEFECASGFEFTKDDLGVTVFTSKAEALKQITELV